MLPNADRIRAAAETFEPGYVALWRAGALAQRREAALDRLRDCDLCARDCHVDRLAGTAGAVCRTGRRAVVHSAGPHFGEERCLVGDHGSGTIFFSWCNLRCLYCQNWEISWRGDGRELSDRALADTMLELQAEGCHNINLVSPSHVVAQVIAALELAVADGLRLPLVYNTGGYDSPAALALLDGIVDIYMPDMKYGDADLARRYSKVRDYVAVNRAAVKEMHRQVGDLVVEADGMARRGLLVRHLVLPNAIAGSDAVLRFLAEEISPHTYVNIMDQYRPCYRADEQPDLSRGISAAEYGAALEVARRHGLDRLDDRPARFW